MSSVSDNVHSMYINGNATPESALRELSTLPYFTAQTLAKITGANSNTNNKLLSRWTKNGKVMRIKRGMYVAEDFYNFHNNDFGFIQAISTIINRLSYTSLEFVLQKYNILTEVTYTVSAVTTKKSSRVANKLGNFYYKSIDPKLFGGYITKDYFGIIINEATLEKALFDYLYFRPIYGLLRSFKLNLAEELRLNIDLLTPEQISKFGDWCIKSEKTKMKMVLKNFMEYVWKKN